jgi:dolichyl-phosphate-mannose-protein mannosyltransferase
MAKKKKNTGAVIKQDKADSPAPVRKQKHSRLDRLDFTILLVIVVLTIVIRLIGISYPEEVYFDETHYVPAAKAYLTPDQQDPNFIHPPLGKQLMALFMWKDQDSSVNWRLGSVLFGSLMVVITYLLGISLFKSRFAASISALLLSADFLHIVQSRIATLDVYIGFFTLAGYYFTWLAYRSFKQEDTKDKEDRDENVSLKRPWFYLLWSGVFFGGAVAVKLSGIAGPLGGYLFLIIALWMDKKRFPTKELAMSAGVFAISMSAVYFLSHIPYLLKMENVSQVLSRDKFSEVFLYSRTFKFHYTDKFTHPYLSQLWQWPTVHRPIWYFYDKVGDKVSGIFAFGNLLFWWSFLVVLIDMVYRTIREKDRRLIFILCGYFPLYLFWLSSLSNYGGEWHFKGGFFYYMLPLVPFMALAVAETLDDLRNTKFGKVSVAIYLAGILLFLVFYYPLLTGAPISSEYYEQLLKLNLFKSWI